MSFLSNLFNRKEHVPDKDQSEDIPAFSEEEDPENEPEKEYYFAVEPKKISSPEEVEEEEYEVVEREILPAKIICPDCGGITLEGLDFCDKCGGELK
jgi:hypothetical protein